MTMTASVWKLSFTLPYEHVEAFSTALEEAFTPAASAVSTSEAEPGAAPAMQTASPHSEIEARGIWRIEAFYEEEPAAAGIARLISPVEEATGIAIGDLTIAPVPEIDWVAKSLEGLDPVHAGRFFVHGSHDAHRVPAAAIPVRVEAAQAFGTGHHETTRGCLEYISEIIRVAPPLNALDLGTGTGVLAIALAKATRRNVLASDIDARAVEAAMANARMNGVASFITAVTAAGFSHPALAARAPYDLIVANILARPLVALAPLFRARLAPGGTLVLSGILKSQETMVTSACRSQGLRLVSRKRMGDWVTLRIGG
jgi:ribosomal protein L11 methyltransferase